MAITLDIPPAIEQTLEAQAHARGLTLEIYLRNVIEGLVRFSDPSPATIQDLRSTLDRLAEMGNGLPSMASATFGRESMYQDHD